MSADFWLYSQGEDKRNDKYVVKILNKMPEFAVMSNEEAQKIILDFGKSIKEAREKNNMSQLDLATASGLDVRHIQRIENSENATSIVNAVKIARVLQISIDSILL